jgi:hypothetical protein
MPAKKTEPTTDAAPAASDQPAGADQVQNAFDAAADKGFFGTSPDPTPRHHYTVPGQIAGKGTPETDDELARRAADPKDVW